MNARAIHEGLGILLSYECREKYCQGEHDELWAPGPDPDLLTPEHEDRLKELGWIYDESFESWHCFT